MTRRLLLWLLSVFATLATLALLLVAAVLWYGHTQSALDRAVAEAVARSGDHLQIDGARGSVLGPLAFARIVWKDGTTAIVAEDVQATWSPRALLSRRLQISELKIARLTVSDTGQSQATALPDSLALPLPLAIDRLEIGTVGLNLGGTVAQVSAVELAYAADESGHHIRGLRFDSALGSARADLGVAMQAPFKLNGKIGLSHPDPRIPIDANATLGGELATPTLAFDATVGTARINGAATLRPFEPSWLQALSFEGKAANLAQFDAEWPRTDLSLSGMAATGPDATLAGSFEIVNAVPGTLGDGMLPVGRAEGGFRVQDRQVRLTAMRVALAGGGSATGSAAISANRVELDLALSAVDLRAIHRSLRSTRLAGTVQAQIAGDGVSAKALLRERDLTLALDVLQRGSQVDLRQFRAEARGGSLTGSGRLTVTDPMPFVVNARATHFNPAAFGDFVVASVDAEIAVTGVLQPRWSADVRFTIDERSRLRGVRLAGDGHAEASAERVHDVALRLSIASNTLQVRGAFGQPGDQLAFKLDAPRLKQLDPMFDGVLSASGSISGPMSGPAVSFDVHGQALRVGERYSAASLTATGRIAFETNGQAEWNIAARNLSTPQIEVASASLRLNGTLASHEAEFMATGPQIDARLKLAGGFQDGDHPKWRGSLLALDQRGDIAVTLLNPVPMEFDRDGGQLSDLVLNVASGRLAVRQLRWGARGFSSDGEFTAIPAAPLMKLAAVGGNVHSTVLLGGDWSVSASPRLNGGLRIRREAGDLTSKDIAGLALGLTSLDIDARFDNDVLTGTLSAGSAQFGTANVRLEATPPPGTQAGALDRHTPAHLAASFELASLKAVEVFTGTSAAVDGRLSAKLEGTGTLGAFKLTGRVDGDDLRIDAPQYGVAIGSGRLRAELGNDELRVSELLLIGGDGRFTATGTLPLRADAGASSTVQWKAEKFTLLNRPDSRLVLDGSGALTWTAGRVALSGSLRAVEGHFEFESTDTTRLSDDVVIKGRPGPAFDNSRASLAKVPLKLDLDLDLGSQLTVIGRGFEGRLSGEVKVSTADDGTLLARGRVTAVNGTYLAFGQKLVLERGDIYFDGPIANPSLDFFAVRRNLPVEVGIAITGTARAPRAQLTSNPPLSDGEKLSWLVLGHGLDRSAGNDNAALQSAAALLFRSTLGGTGTRTLASTVGLDDISVHGRADGAEGQVLSFGRRIADNLYIAFDQGLTIATNALRVEYTLSRNWMLRAEAGVVSSFGLYYTESFR